MKSGLITSRDNRRLVEVRKVRDGKVADKVFIEGRHLVVEALRSNIDMETVFLADDLHDDELRDSLRAPVFEVRAELFKSIADTDNPQGVIAISQRPITGREMIERRSAVKLVVFLNAINNPSNLGAVMRTAEAAGVRGVIVSKRSADVFSPKALRAAMGSSFRLPIWDEASFEEVLRWATQRQMITTAADVGAANSYTNIDWTIPRLLVVGSEAGGLSTGSLKKVDEIVRIPMENDVESLNLAVAAGIIFFEAKRQNEL
jgi:TrmH family RNA methyltransferase